MIDSQSYPADPAELFSLKPEENENKVWRYMDLAKFMSMLEFKEFYFNRGDCFEDKAEGSYSEVTIDKIDNAIQNSLLMITGINLSQNETRKLVKIINQINRASVFINCWHMNEVQSYAMWNLYSKDEKGIAIQSTVNKLKKSFDSNSIFLEKVKYINFKPDQMDYIPIKIDKLAEVISIKLEPLYTFCYKRINLEHEKEIRLIIDNSCSLDLPLPKDLLNQVSDQLGVANFKKLLESWEEIASQKLEKLIAKNIGIKVSIESDCMNDLIENVYISPKAPNWFKSLLEKIITRYNLQCQVIKSDLDNAPLL